MKDGERLLLTWDRGDDNRTLVRLRDYQGRQYLDLRRYFRADDGRWLPTKQGVSLNMEQAVELLDTLRALDVQGEGAGQKTGRAGSAADGEAAW